MSLTTITFPSVANPAKVTWGMERKDGRFESPLSGTFQDIGRPGARWVATFSWSTLTESDWHKLSAWAAQMTAAGVRCALPNYAYERLGSGDGTPLVNGASQTGTSLNTKGWTPNATGVLLTGDMIVWINADGTHQLVMVTADADADASGNATLSIVPAIRTSPADATSINKGNAPNAQFALSKPDTSFNFMPPRLGTFTISLVEDIQA